MAGRSGSSDDPDMLSQGVPSPRRPDGGAADAGAAERGGDASGTVSLRHNRNFTLLWLSRAASETGEHLGLFVYPLIALSITGSAIDAGVIGGAVAVAKTIARLPAGALVDRYDRTRLMVVCEAGRAIAIGVTAVAMFAGRASIGLILVAACLDGLLASFFVPAEHAALRVFVPAGQIATALSRNQARAGAAIMAGPLIGGTLLSLGNALPLAISAALYATSTATVARLPNAPVSRVSRSGIVRGVGTGLAFIAAQPFLRVFTICAVGVNLGASGLVFTLVVGSAQAGHSKGVIGAAITIATACGVLGALSAPWFQRRLPGGWIVLAVFYVTITMPVAFWLTTNPVPLAAVLAIGFLLSPVADVVLHTHVLATAPLDLQGRVSSAILLATGLGNSAGPLVVGFLLESFGRGAAMAALVVVFVVVAAVATASPNIRGLQSSSVASSVQ